MMKGTKYFVWQSKSILQRLRFGFQALISNFGRIR
jgi:hypothetical protein